MDNMEMLRQALIVSGWGMLWGFSASALLYAAVYVLRSYAGRLGDAPDDDAVPLQ